MTSEEARMLFDAALDDELSAQEQVEFDQALANDAVLNADYERHQSVVRQTSQLFGARAEVDLLAGVQHKLRARSGGKFYRDRFAERSQGGLGSDSMKLLIVLSACLIVGVLLWFAYDGGLLSLTR